MTGHTTVDVPDPVEDEPPGPSSERRQRSDPLVVGSACVGLFAGLVISVLAFRPDGEATSVGEFDPAPSPTTAAAPVSEFDPAPPPTTAAAPASELVPAPPPTTAVAPAIDVVGDSELAE